MLEKLDGGYRSRKNRNLQAIVFIDTKNNHTLDSSKLAEYSNKIRIERRAILENNFNIEEIGPIVI